MLFDRLEQSLRGSGRNARLGVEPLQRLLAAFEIAPTVPEAICSAINELAAVRNQLVYHGGRVDARFGHLWPALLKRRGRISVSYDMFYRYQKSAVGYPDPVLHTSREAAGFSPLLHRRFSCRLSSLPLHLLALLRIVALLAAASGHILLKGAAIERER